MKIFSKRKPSRWALGADGVWRLAREFWERIKSLPANTARWLHISRHIWREYLEGTPMYRIRQEKPGVTYKRGMAPRLT